jgi:phage shock protein PspC (stress-responsive transcriptional regulator)
VLGGVCGGLADHLGIDVAAVRVATVLLAITGWGLLLYLIGWVALPVSDSPPPVRPRGARGQRGRIPWLPIAIAIALLFTLPSGFSVMFGHGHMGNAAVPILLLGGVAYLMWRATRGELPRRRGPHGPPAFGPGHPGHGWSAPPPAEASTASTLVQSTAGPGPTPGPAQAPPSGPSPATDDRPLWARDDDLGPPPAAPAAAGMEGQPDDPDEDPLLAEARRLSDPFLTEPLLFETARSLPPAPTVPAPPPRRRGAGRALLAALLIGAGAVGLAVALGVPFTPFTVLAGLLVAFGIALVFGGLSGRSSRGLILPGMIVFGLLSVASLIDFRGPPSAGDVSVTPATLAEVEPSYHLGLGELTIDLSGVDFPSGGTTVEASIGAGDLTVIVPSDADVTVHAHAGAGEISAFGETAEGINRDLDVTVDGRGEGAGELTLDLDVNLGEITVEQGGRSR